MTFCRAVAYYWYLGRVTRHALPPFLWALVKVANNRATYGAWGSGT